LKVRGVKEFHDHLDELTPLNEAELLRYLKNQFRVNNIYTRTGSTLVALNPFKWMLSAYTNQVVTKYHAGVSDEDAIPHIYQEVVSRGRERYIVCVVRLFWVGSALCILTVFYFVFSFCNLRPRMFCVPCTSWASLLTSSSLVAVAVVKPNQRNSCSSTLQKVSWFELLSIDVVVASHLLK
jgi:hypothetical protein